MNRSWTDRQQKLIDELNEFIDYAQATSVRKLSLPAGKFKVFKTIARKIRTFDLAMELQRVGGDDVYRGIAITQKEKKEKPRQPQEQPLFIE